MIRMIRASARRRQRAGVRRELMPFYGAPALALIVVSIGDVVASQSVARSQAPQDAQRMTVRLGTLVVAPLLADALEGNTERSDELNRALSHRMKDGYLGLITVWDAAGRVVQSILGSRRGIGRGKRETASSRPLNRGHPMSEHVLERLGDQRR